MTHRYPCRETSGSKRKGGKEISLYLEIDAGMIPARRPHDIAVGVAGAVAADLIFVAEEGLTTDPIVLCGTQGRTQASADLLPLEFAVNARHFLVVLCLESHVSLHVPLRAFRPPDIILESIFPRIVQEASLIVFSRGVSVVTVSAQDVDVGRGGQIRRALVRKQWSR